MMPSSVIKHKVRLSQMTPDEARTYFSALTYEKVRDMERRHCVKPGTYFRWRVPAMPIGNPCE